MTEDSIDRLLVLRFTGSIDRQKIESNPQLYPLIVKRANKLGLDRCPLDKLTNLLIDVWGTGQLTVKTVYSFGGDWGSIISLRL
jgi:hypothetical protein